MHVVMRPLPEGGNVLQPGTVVDAGRWPNTPLLVSQRYLRDATDEEKAGATPNAPGKRRTA